MSIESCCAAEVFLVFKSRFLPGTNQLALSVRPPFGFVFVFTALRILGSQFLGEICVQQDWFSFGLAPVLTNFVSGEELFLVGGSRSLILWQFSVVFLFGLHEFVIAFSLFRLGIRWAQCANKLQLSILGL